MVVAAEVAARLVEPLAVVRSSELSPPDDERVVEHPPVGEILDKGRRRLVGLPSLAADPSRQAAVMIPVLMIELDEAHPPLRQPPGEEAIGRERAGLARPRAVFLDHMRWLVGKIRDVGNARLHPEGELVVGDPSRDLGIGIGGELMLVELFQSIEGSAAVLARHASRIAQVKDRIAAGAEAHRLMAGGEEA